MSEHIETAPAETSIHTLIKAYVDACSDYDASHYLDRQKAREDARSDADARKDAALKLLVAVFERDEPLARKSTATALAYAYDRYIENGHPWPAMSMAFLANEFFAICEQPMQMHRGTVHALKTFAQEAA
ncbi:MAG: hypothetical protein AAGG72_00060 [Pseudomonadota bacterium]